MSSYDAFTAADNPALQTSTMLIAVPAELAVNTLVNWR
jgi:hypothetical protein